MYSKLILTKRASRVAAATVSLLGLLVLSACGSGSADSDTGFKAASGSTALANRPKPVPNQDKKQVKIAVVAGAPEVAEFFKAYAAGIQRANSVLKPLHAKVDYIRITSITPEAFNSSLRTAITQGYDAIATQILGSANCAALKEAVDKGIKVAVINSTAACAETSGVTFFHGENAFDAWRDNVAKALINATGGKTCKVGIITAGFAIEAMEQRRKGVIAGLEGSNLTPVDKGVDVGVDPAKTQAATRDYVTANPDLCGIVVLFGDNGAAAASLSSEQAKNVKVVSGDLTKGTVQQIKDGKLAAAFTQDPFGQTYDTSIWLYNTVITGKGPAGGYAQPSKGLIVTADNVDKALKDQSGGQ